MLEAKVNRPSTSNSACSIFLVKKRDSALCFCVDYRRLNGGTRKDSLTVPRIDQTLDSLCGAHYFPTPDLASGYWPQLPGAHFALQPLYREFRYDCWALDETSAKGGVFARFNRELRSFNDLRDRPCSAKMQLPQGRANCWISQVVKSGPR